VRARQVPSRCPASCARSAIRGARGRDVVPICGDADKAADGRETHAVVGFGQACASYRE
jgi:hypothetical protein